MSRAQQNPTGRLRRASSAVGLGLAALLASAACGAGQVTQTDSQLPAVNGTQAQIGAIAVRDASLAYPHDGHFAEGGDAPLIVTLINTGTAADTLVAVTSPVAGDVELTGDTAMPGGVTLSVGTPGEEAETESSAAPTPTPTTTTTSAGETTTGSATPTTTTTTPAPTTEAVERGKLTVVLTGLTEALYPGKTIPVTFVFANAGSVTVDLPIAAPSDPRVADTEH